MPTADLSQLTFWVLASVFALAALFGFTAQRTHFCTMGAISDVVNMGDWSRMRSWVLAVALAMLGFHALVWWGAVRAEDTLYAGGRVAWLSLVLGGAMFGFGMVLASGCGSKTLVRIGEGNLKSLVVFVVMGIAAYATMRGITGVWRTATVDQVAITLPSARPADWLVDMGLTQAGPGGMLLATLVALLLLFWVWRDAHFRQSPDAIVAGVVIGLLVVAMWWVTGTLGYTPEHPETLEPAYLASAGGRPESFSFTAPMAYTLHWLMLYSDASNVLNTGIVSVLGVVLGACVSALTSKRFRWEGFQGARDTGLHVGGAVLMGVGGVLALGCTVGQGLSGLSTLSVSSVLAVLGIGLGAVAGLRFQMALLMRDD
ncbi:MAG: YeeE/YedE family protein [Burkholderiaceae bacterium]|jgi:uncharacterized membrane protein YedE/YeeE